MEKSELIAAIQRDSPFSWGSGIVDGCTSRNPLISTCYRVDRDVYIEAGCHGLLPG
jgi:hypothetical protein